MVRRQFYLPSSPAGRGAVWQWAGDTPGEWHSYDMDVQCLIEAVWSLVSSPGGGRSPAGEGSERQRRDDLNCPL